MNNHGGPYFVRFGRVHIYFARDFRGPDAALDFMSRQPSQHIVLWKHRRAPKVHLKKFRRGNTLAS